MLIDWLMNRFAIPSSMILFEWYVSTSTITNSHDDADRSVQIHTKTRQNKIQIKEFQNKDCLSVWNGFDESMIIPSIPTLYTISFSFFLYIFYLSNLPYMYSVLCTRQTNPAHQTSSFHTPHKPECPKSFPGVWYSICPVVHERGGKIYYLITEIAGYQRQVKLPWLGQPPAEEPLLQSCALGHRYGWDIYISR